MIEPIIEIVNNIRIGKCSYCNGQLKHSFHQILDGPKCQNCNEYFWMKEYSPSNQQYEINFSCNEIYINCYVSELILQLHIGGELLLCNHSNGASIPKFKLDLSNKEKLHKRLRSILTFL